VASGKEEAQFQYEGNIKCVAVSPKGARAVTVARYGETNIWDVATGTAQAQLRHKDHVESVQFSLDGTKLITTSMDGTVRIWDIATGKEQALFARNGKISSATFSPDGRKLVIISKDDLVRARDVHWLTQYRGRELIQRVCQEKLVGANHLTKQDIELSPILSGREGEDVCNPPSWFSRFAKSFGFGANPAGNSSN
jgi:WD40 repeat protein